MKKYYIIVALLAFSITVWADTAKPAKKIEVKIPKSPIAGAKWKLTFNDEFDGKVIDPNKWYVVHADRTCRDKNFWHRDCAKLDGKGKLKMITRESPDKKGWHDTACLRTLGKFGQIFGYYEIRAKMHTQEGFWTAFWAMPVKGGISSTKNAGMDGTELDIFEKFSLDDRVQHTLHWDGYGKEHKSKGHVPKVPGVMKGYHDFGLLWTPDEYVFYIDGKETWRTSAGDVCQVPVYLKISAEKGTWGGDIAKATLPDEFVVDYVRVYQLYDKDDKVAFKAKQYDNTKKEKR
ncbi:MAG: glycoside hydrolase family 16 protein [Phycisphaerae bacterium]|nr:glycoside hydrolase family 16 protein [Phycisphaerae bacterium]